jgi:hypothetical protein
VRPQRLAASSTTDMLRLQGIVESQDNRTIANTPRKLTRYGVSAVTNTAWLGVPTPAWLRTNRSGFRRSRTASYG